MPVAPPMAKPNDRRRSRRDRDIGFRPSGKLEQIAWLDRRTVIQQGRWYYLIPTRVGVALRLASRHGTGLCSAFGAFELPF
jgi:hypothetical protein